MVDGTCPIWGTTAEVYPQVGRAQAVISPRTGGDYRVSFEALIEIGKDDFGNREKARLTTWLVDRRREGTKCPEINQKVIENIRINKNLQFTQKKKRFFDYLIYLNICIGENVQLTELSAEGRSVDYSPRLELWRKLNEISAWIESSNDDEVEKFLKLMHDSGYIKYDSEKHIFDLTAAGWEKFEEYQSDGAISNQIFVAMWFGGTTDVEKMNNLFEEGIEKGILDCDLGLKALRIDKVEHDEKVCDQIIAEIRRSKLVVADFTCPSFTVDEKKHHEVRGNVYYEAGFAKGLGIPVIFTCNKKSEVAMQFDTRQYNHILWENHAELAEKLKQRIRARFNPN